MGFGGSCGGCGFAGGFALLVVLFILLIIVGCLLLLKLSKGHSRECPFFMKKLYAMCRGSSVTSTLKM